VKKLSEEETMKRIFAILALFGAIIFGAPAWAAEEPVSAAAAAPAAAAMATQKRPRPRRQWSTRATTPG
jgi:hypothetical protein